MTLIVMGLGIAALTMFTHAVAGTAAAAAVLIGASLMGGWYLKTCGF